MAALHHLAGNNMTIIKQKGGRWATFLFNHQLLDR